MNHNNVIFFSAHSQEGGGSSAKAVDDKKKGTCDETHFMQPVVSGLPAERKTATPAVVSSGQLDQIRTNTHCRHPTK